MDAWRKEIGIFLLLAAVTSIAGALTGLFFPLTFLLILAILLRQCYQITRFERWISNGGRGGYPKTSGIWEEIYYSVYRIKKNEKRRKKKLGKIVDQFRQSTEALPDAAVVLGPHDEIEWANKAARDVLGLQQSDKGQRIPNLVRFPEFIHYLKSGDYQNSIILPSPVDDNISLSVRIVSYGAGLRLLLAQDVTQLKQMERMRKDFVANVSHELRTPLTVLKGYLETLQDMDEGNSAMVTGSLEQMRGQTERMQHLVDDLLLLARLETQRKNSHCVGIPALLQQICKDSGDLAEVVGRIQLTLTSNAHITGDEQELRSAFTNLIENAIKYSPDDTVVKVSWYQDREALVLAVEDQGEGIAASELPRVTERFYRAEVQRTRKVSGTGLGLAIVKHVLMRHDARLHIVSELGKGSCFSCHFPLNRICN